MRAGSREFLFVVSGVVLGCLALLGAFVLPGLLRGTDSAQTRVTGDQAALVPQGETPSATPPDTATTAPPEPLATPATGRPSATGTPRTPAATRTATARVTGGATAGTTPTATRGTARPSTSAVRTTPPQSSPPTTGPAATAPAGAQKATFYAPAAPGGACMTLTIPASRYTAAVGPAEFDGSAACGEYLQVTGARGTILVKVDNLCPECPPGHIDLSNEAFAALDDPVKGIVPVSYRVVQNPPVSGGIVVQVKDGSSRFWLALHIDNTGNALRAVEVSDNRGPLRPMTRSGNAFWVLANSPGNGPFTVRITDVAGHVATLPSVSLSPGRPQTTGVRLY